MDKHEWCMKGITNTNLIADLRDAGEKNVMSSSWFPATRSDESMLMLRLNVMLLKRKGTRE